MTIKKSQRKAQTSVIVIRGHLKEKRRMSNLEDKSQEEPMMNSEEMMGMGWTKVHQKLVQMPRPKDKRNESTRSIRSKRRRRAMAKNSRGLLTHHSSKA